MIKLKDFDNGKCVHDSTELFNEFQQDAVYIILQVYL